MKHSKDDPEIIPQNIRRYLYQVAAATMPLLVAYGAISDTVAPLWLALVQALFIAPIAAIHTPKVDTNE